MTQHALYDASLYRPEPPASWWEASAPPPQAGYGPLEGDARTEVAVIGAGYTGLSAAYHLAKEQGIEATVLDAGPIGWGASGRNGGFCCFPAGKLGLKAMLDRFGEAETKRYYDSQREGVDLVEALGRDEGIDFDRQGEGFASVAHHPGFTEGEREYGEALTRRFGVPTRFYTAAEYAEVGHRGTEQFGALQIRHGFGLHPMKLLSGLAAAAARRGAWLHGRSRVTEWRREGGLHRLVTPGGTVTARFVVVAANGFLQEGLHPAFDGRLLPALSNIVVTRPLSEAEVAAENFVTEDPLANARHLLFYYRMLPGRRLLFGARGDTSGKPEAAERMRAWLTRRLGEVFPAFAGAETTHFWRGLVCLTRTMMPAVGRLPDDPSVLFAYGCHGNGVNTMPWAGRALARLVRGANREEDVIPAAVRGLSPRFPLPALRVQYLKAAYAWYKLKDK